MKLHPARLIACRALVVGGLFACSAWAEPPLPTPTTAMLAAGGYVKVISVEPLPLRTYVEAGGNAIEAFELGPGTHRVTVEYEESRKRKVEGFVSRDTRTSSLDSPRPSSRCVLDFDFQAGTLYRIVRSSVGEDGKLKRLPGDNWGVWLVAAEWNQPLAQCL